MIHTKVTPNDVLVSISFYVPKSYIGKELEVIVFSSGEGVQKSVAVNATVAMPEAHQPVIEKIMNEVNHNPKSDKSWKKLKDELDEDALKLL
jgi:hypothetical protein